MVELMRSFHRNREGKRMSFARIAEELNARNVPTRTGANWHTTTVMNILIARVGGWHIDAHEICRQIEAVSKPKKAKPAESAPTPGTVMAAKIRARANKLTDAEREALMGDAMRIIYGTEGDAVRAHRR